MKYFRDPKYVKRYEDVVFDLETALNTTVANNAKQKKNGHRFVVDNRTFLFFFVFNILAD